ncbi:MAG TPA: YbhB/YbcL family Raf kinase inhibitor-like protein [bacterium]|nr:YbhB/YbcL family Raf kinase inhibitor-like protein [bacterium]
MRSLIVAAAMLLATPAFAAAGKFTVTSTDVKAGGTLGNKHVFNGMGCTGDNLSPQISWSNAPEGTKSFAVTIYDPDAPTGSGWWHWVVYNIPADTKELAEGAGTAAGDKLPAGTVQGRTDFGAPGFGGACPPPGDKPHHYKITVTALKVDKLDVPAEATAAYVGFMTHMNALGSASITATYARPTEKVAEPKKDAAKKEADKPKETEKK